MLRTAAGVVAAGLLLWAGILVGSGASVSYAGASMTCPGPIVRAETGSSLPDRGTASEAAGLARACERSDHHRLWWASLAAVLSLGAAAAAAGAAGRRKDRHADPSLVDAGSGRPVAC